MNEHQAVTLCIVHLTDSANFKFVTSNKLCNGLIGSCFKSPNDTIHLTFTLIKKNSIIMIINAALERFLLISKK
jgi:hypothetical protein